MLSVNFAECSYQILLLLVFRRTGSRVFIDEIVKARELPQTILPPELIESWHAALAVADQVQGDDVDLLRLGVEARNFQVLQEPRVVLQREQTQPLAAHAERPVGEASRPHCFRRLGLKRLHHWNLVPNLVWIRP